MTDVDLMYISLALTGGTVLVFFAVIFLKEWRKSRERDFELKKVEIDLKYKELERSENNVVIKNENQTSSADLGGYITIEIPEDRKSIFQDLLKGFEEYALLKGYKVSVSIDSSEIGKISFKIVVNDFGITSNRKTIKEDLNEYIEKIKNGAPLDDLPEVLDPMEHSRITMALKNRVTFLQQNYEVERNIREFYQGFINKLPIQAINHSNPIFHITNSGSAEMDQRKYIANNSANVMQGDHHSNTIEFCDINIGSTFTEKKEQIGKIEELIAELKTNEEIEGQQGAIRHLENIKEELEDSETPDKSLVSKWLSKASTIIGLAEKSSTLFAKAKAVFDSFGFTI